MFTEILFFKIFELKICIFPTLSSRFCVAFLPPVVHFLSLLIFSFLSLLLRFPLANVETVLRHELVFRLRTLRALVKSELLLFFTFTGMHFSFFLRKINKDKTCRASTIRDQPWRPVSPLGVLRPRPWSRACRRDRVWECRPDCSLAHLRPVLLPGKT